MQLERGRFSALCSKTRSDEQVDIVDTVSDRTHISTDMLMTLHAPRHWVTVIMSDAKGIFHIDRLQLHQPYVIRQLLHAAVRRRRQ